MRELREMIEEAGPLTVPFTSFDIKNLILFKKNNKKVHILNKIKFCITKGVKKDD
jgi:hypothetical protein